MEPDLTELLTVSLPDMALMDPADFEWLVRDLLGDSPASFPGVCASPSSSIISSSTVRYSATSPLISYSSPASDPCWYFQDSSPSHSGQQISISGLMSPTSTPGSYRLISPNYSPSPSSSKSHINTLSSPSSTSSVLESAPSSSSSKSHISILSSPSSTSSVLPSASPSSSSKSVSSSSPEAGMTSRRRIVHSLVIRYRDFEDMIRPRDDGELVPYHVLEPYLNMNFDLLDEESDWE